MRFVFAVSLSVTAAMASGQSFVKAQFIFFRSVDGKTYNPPKQLVITDKSELVRLAKLIPGLGYNKGGLKPGGWDAWGTVRLMRSTGPGIAVFFSTDGKVFSVVGKQGDFPAGRGLKEYLVEAEKRAKA